MSLLMRLLVLFLLTSPACALTCTPPIGKPRDQIAAAYDQSDVVALVSRASALSQERLRVKAVWKGNPKPRITVKFTWADLPERGDFVVFASKGDRGYVDSAICLQLWGQREELLRDIYGDPVALPSVAK